MVPGIEVLFEFRNGETMTGRPNYQSVPRGLTDREKEVWRLACEGLSRRKICQRLHLSKSTIDGYFEKARDKTMPVGEDWDHDQFVAYGLKHPEILK